MVEQLTREQLVDLVRKIMNSKGTEQEIDDREAELQRNVPHPEVSGLIFYPQVPMTPEEIVEIALAYQPLQRPASTNEKS